MPPWEDALSEFTSTWKDRDEVTGFLVCGSYVTGNPSKRSDIDLVILLSEATDWRERGDKIVNGFLVEYFANPPRQVRSYFRDDHRRRRRNAATQFATGRILLDETGALAELAAEARGWLRKPFDAPGGDSLGLTKYGLWDGLDNVRDLLERGSPSFHYAYFGCLAGVVSEYCAFLGVPTPPASRIHELLTDLSARRKYLEPEFPDARFVELVTAALGVAEKPEMARRLEEATRHVIDAMGGFEIDGWRFRSPLSL